IRHVFSLFFFFTASATTEFYTLSLHDALPIYVSRSLGPLALGSSAGALNVLRVHAGSRPGHECAPHPILFVAREMADVGKLARRSEEHTSELQSRFDLVCRLLLEKKKKNKTSRQSSYYLANLISPRLTRHTPLSCLVDTHLPSPNIHRALNLISHSLPQHS